MSDLGSVALAQRIAARWGVPLTDDAATASTMTIPSMPPSVLLEQLAAQRTAPPPAIMSVTANRAPRACWLALVLGALTLLVLLGWFAYRRAGVRTFSALLNNSRRRADPACDTASAYDPFLTRENFTRQQQRNEQQASARRDGARAQAAQDAGSSSTGGGGGGGGGVFYVDAADIVVSDGGARRAP